MFYTIACTVFFLYPHKTKAIICFSWFVITGCLPNQLSLLITTKKNVWIVRRECLFVSRESFTETAQTNEKNAQKIASVCFLKWHARKKRKHKKRLYTSQDFPLKLIQSDYTSSTCRLTSPVCGRNVTRTWLP